MHYFLQFGIHENAFTITQNALILQLLGAKWARRPSGGFAPPCSGHSPQTSSRTPQHNLFDPPVAPSLYSSFYPHAVLGWCGGEKYTRSAWHLGLRQPLVVPASLAFALGRPPTNSIHMRLPVPAFAISDLQYMHREIVMDDSPEKKKRDSITSDSIRWSERSERVSE